MQETSKEFERSIHEAFDFALKDVEPGRALNDSVINEIHRFGAQQAKTASFASTRPVTRRQFALATVGVLGGVTLAGFGIKSLTSGLLSSNSDGDVVLGTVLPDGHRFGLSIAMANETQESKADHGVYVQTTDDGIVPIIEMSNSSKTLKMNLRVFPEKDIDSVLYSIVETSSKAEEWYEWHACWFKAYTYQEPSEEDAFANGSTPYRGVPLYPGTGSDTVPSGIAIDHYNSGQPDSIVIDYKKSDQFDSQQDKYHACITVDAHNEFYARTSDPMQHLYKKLSAKGSIPWLVEEGYLDEEALWDLEDFNARYREVAANLDTFIEWQRQTFITGYEAVGEVLANTVFKVTVTFNDGSQETREWQLLPVENFSEVLSERFDGLNAAALAYAKSLGKQITLDDLYSERYLEPGEEVLPTYHVFGYYTEKMSQLDSRLSAPLFQIVEVKNE